MFFKILKAVESFVSLVRGWGSWPLPFQQGQEVTWGNVFALRMRAWIAANNLHLFAYWTRTHKRDYNKNLFWTAAYSLPLELCGAGTGRCQPFTHSLWPTSLPRFAVWVLMLLKKKKKKVVLHGPCSPHTPWIHLRSEILDSVVGMPAQTVAQRQWVSSKWLAESRNRNETQLRGFVSQIHKCVAFWNIRHLFFLI